MSPFRLWGAHLIYLKELDFPSSAAGKWEDELEELVDLDTMYYAKTSFVKVSLPPNSRFILGETVHIKFDIAS